MPISSPYNFALNGVLGALIGKVDNYNVSQLKELVGENTLIGCLIQKESSWNINAIGDSGKAIGILQFHQSTFDMFSKKYNLDLDIYNPLDQILLANLMLEENIRNIIHWSVWKQCLK